MENLTPEKLSEINKKRIQSIKLAKTPEELSLLIWYPSDERSIEYSRNRFRLRLTNWIDETKNGWKSTNLNYKTSKDLVEDLINPRYDLEDNKEFYNEFRETIQHKIEEFIV